VTGSDPWAQYLKPPGGPASAPDDQWGKYLKPPEGRLAQFPGRPGPDWTPFLDDDGKQTGWQSPNLSEVRFVYPTLMDAAKNSPAGGFVRGLIDIPDAGAQLLTRGLEAVAPAGSKFEAWAADQRRQVEAINREREDIYRKEWRQGEDVGMDAGRVAGNVVGSLPTSIFLPGATALKLAPRLANATAAGATGGALTPVTPEENATEGFWSTKGKQVGMGAGIGAALAPITGALSRFISPKASTEPNVQKLLKEGVTLTPGQAGGGIVKKTEDALASVPVVGDLIGSAQRRSIEGLNKAALNRALAPIGQKLPGNINIGRDGVAHVQQSIGDAYEALLPRLRIQTDDAFLRDVGELHTMAQSLEPNMAKKFGETLKTKVMDKLAPAGSMDGHTMKAMESDLGQLATKFRTSASASEREFGDAVQELQAKVRDLVTRSNPEQAAELQKINRAYANLAVVERAAGGAGATGGVFSAPQLSSAVKASDRSVRDRRFAAGQATMQDLSDAGREVLPSSVPDSGTARRLLTGLGLLGGGAMVDPLSAAGVGALSSLYTRPGMAALNWAMARRPQSAPALARGVLSTTPVLSGAAVPAGRGFYN
jgi:hypothetical protein